MNATILIGPPQRPQLRVDVVDRANELAQPEHACLVAIEGAGHNLFLSHTSEVIVALDALLTSSETLQIVVDTRAPENDSALSNPRSPLPASP